MGTGTKVAQIDATGTKVAQIDATGTKVAQTGATESKTVQRANQEPRRSSSYSATEPVQSDSIGHVMYCTCDLGKCAEAIAASQTAAETQETKTKYREQKAKFIEIQMTLGNYSRYDWKCEVNELCTLGYVCDCRTCSASQAEIHGLKKGCIGPPKCLANKI